MPTGDTILIMSEHFYTNHNRVFEKPILSESQNPDGEEDTEHDEQRAAHTH